MTLLTWRMGPMIPLLAMLVTVGLLACALLVLLLLSIRKDTARVAQHTEAVRELHKTIAEAVGHFEALSVGVDNLRLDSRARVAPVKAATQPATVEQQKLHRVGRQIQGKKTMIVGGDPEAQQFRELSGLPEDKEE